MKTREKRTGKIEQAIRILEEREIEKMKGEELKAEIHLRDAWRILGEPKEENGSKWKFMDLELKVIWFGGEIYPYGQEIDRIRSQSIYNDEITQHNFVIEKEHEVGRQVVGKGCQGYVNTNKESKGADNNRMKLLLPWAPVERESCSEMSIVADTPMSSDTTEDFGMDTVQEKEEEETIVNEEEFRYKNDNNEIIDHNEKVVVSMKEMIELEGQKYRACCGDLVEWDGGGVTPMKVVEAYQEDNFVIVAEDPSKEGEMGEWAVKANKVYYTDIKTVWRSPFTIRQEKRRGVTETNEKMLHSYAQAAGKWLEEIDNMQKEEEKHNPWGIRAKNLRISQTWLKSIVVSKEKEGEKKEKEHSETIKGMQERMAKLHLEEKEKSKQREKKASVEADTAQQNDTKKKEECKKYKNVDGKEYTIVTTKGERMSFKEAKEAFTEKPTTSRTSNASAGTDTETYTVKGKVRNVPMRGSVYQQVKEYESKREEINNSEEYIRAAEEKTKVVFAKEALKDYITEGKDLRLDFNSYTEYFDRIEVWGESEYEKNTVAFNIHDLMEKAGATALDGNTHITVTRRVLHQHLKGKERWKYRKSHQAEIKEIHENTVAISLDFATKLKQIHKKTGKMYVVLRKMDKFHMKVLASPLADAIVAIREQYPEYTVSISKSELHTRVQPYMKNMPEIVYQEYEVEVQNFQKMTDYHQFLIGQMFWSFKV